jgi:hypothetical protein
MTKPLRSSSFIVNRKSYLILILLPLLWGWGTLPREKTSLVIAVYDQQAAQNHIVHLVKIPFTGGIAGTQEKVMDIATQQPGDKVPRIRFDLGPNQVYRNRWVITAYGNVIDLVQKEVLVDQHDQFISASGDSLVFYTNDIFKGKYYSWVNLATGEYKKIEKPSFSAKTGRDVEADCSSRNYKIFLYPPSAPKIELVRDAGYGEDISLIPGARQQCPIFWLNNDEFIYPNYSAEKNYVAIWKVNAVTKEQEKVGEIDRLPENHKLSRFYRAPDGVIVYECSRGHFSIDLKRKVAEEMKDLPEGNEFTIASDETPGKGRKIRHKGTEIGTYFCDPFAATTAEGLIAFPFEIAMGEEHYLQGAAVWSAAAAKWKTIGDSDLAAVVGWVEE